MSVPDIQHALDLLRQREVDAAISALEKKVDEIPAHLTAHALLARAYETRGDWSQALRSWENAHFLMPNSPTIRNGKKRVLSRIDESDARAPAQDATSPDASPTGSPPTGASSTGASPTGASPESSSRSSPESSPASSTAITDDASPARADAPRRESEVGDDASTDASTRPDPSPAGAAEPAEPEDPAATPGSAANDVARRAQALLSDTPTPPVTSPSKPSPEETSSAEPSPEASSNAEPSAAKSTASQAPVSGDSDSGDRSSRDANGASSDPGASAPEDDPVEIRTSRRPGTTSFRPDTAIIDAASSLLSQEPTPSADDPSPSAGSEEAENDSPNLPPSQDEANPENQDPSEDDASSEGDASSDLEALRRSAEEEARRGGARPDMSAAPVSESDGAPDDAVGDLDQLIQDLESARIQPSPDLDDLPPPDLDDDVEDLVSETLARIYGAQSQYREAARIYVKLASQEPANARKFLEQAAEMREKAEAKEAEDRAAETRSSGEP